MYVVTGATGNIGSKLTEKLLAEGKKVRVIGRTAAKLQRFVDNGAEAAVGKPDDVDFLTKAFTGATCLFAMIPPDFTTENVRQFQNRVGEAIATAIKKTGVTNVVALSSVGAHLAENTGVVQGLHDQEERLNKIANLNVVHLRAGYFMENTLAQVGVIKAMNTVGTSIKPDVPIPMVATQDIADIAAKIMLTGNFKNKTVRYVLGPRDISYSEVTRIIGEAIGKTDLAYSELPYDQQQKAMVGMGMSKDFARSVSDLTKAMNEGSLSEETKRTPETTTPTSFEEFARTFARLYKS